MAYIKKSRAVQEKEEQLMTGYYENKFYTGGTIQHNQQQQTQVKGVDAWYQTDTSAYTIDEKTAVNWIGVPLKTQAFEILVSWKGENVFAPGYKLHDGWLIGSNWMNNAYMLTHINSATTDYLTSSGEVQSCNSILITKEAVFDYLASIGWNKEKLRRKAYQVWDKEEEPKGNWRENGIQFYRYTNQYEDGKTEASVVVRLPWWQLKKRADIILDNY